MTLDYFAYDAGYLLLGMLSSLVFRAVRDALPDNPAAQERILGASLFAMGVADVRDQIYFILKCLMTYLNRLPSKCCVMPSTHSFTHCFAMRSIIATWIGLPVELRYAIADWNPTTHGNITFVVFLMVSR